MGRGHDPSLFFLGVLMNTEDIQHLRNVLKVFEQAKFNDIDLKTQMDNVGLLSKFSETVRKIESEIPKKKKPSIKKTKVKDVEPK